MGDFSIGKDATEELDDFMREFLWPIAPTRNYDPNDLVRYALRQMIKFNLSNIKPYLEEDVIMN